MPVRVSSSLRNVGRLAAGWVPHGTLPEIEDAALNKIFYPVGTTFLEHEADRAVFFDLRGGEVVAVDVFDKGGIALPAHLA